MRIDDLGELRVFVQVVESGGLSAAGRVLRMSTPQVSRKLARLEAQLGIRLLARSTRRVVLAEEHRAFFERCRQVIREVEAAEEELRAGALEGQVRMAVPTLVLPEVLDALGPFLRQHPQLSLRLRVSDRPLDLLKEGLDLALQVGEPEGRACTAQALGVPRIGLAAAPDYLRRRGVPQRPSDLAQHDCLRFMGEGPQRHWTLIGPDGAAVRAAVGGRFECDDSRALGEALDAGMGIGHRSAALLARDQRAGRLEAVLPGFRFELPPLVLVAPRLRLRSRKVAAFAALLRRAVAATLA